MLFPLICYLELQGEKNFSSMHLYLARVSHKGRREKSESTVNTRHAPKNTRRHTCSMLRIFFKRNAVDAVLIGFATDRL